MSILRDFSLLIARVILGVVLIAHGWQKYNDWTIEGTGKSFDGMGVPSPELSAQFATYFELAAGALLIIGLLVRLVGPILFVQMVGAAWFAHRDSGLFAADGGWELVAVIGAAGLALAGAGAGRISLDHLLATPFRRRKEEKLGKKYVEEHGYGTSAGMAATAPAAGTAATTPATSPAVDRDFGDAKTSVIDTNAGTRGTGTTATPTNKLDVDPNAPTTQWPGDTRK